MKGDVDTAIAAVINRSGANIHGNERETDRWRSSRERENEADALIVAQISMI